MDLDGEFQIRDPKQLREMAEFYGNRPCVELGQTPSMREISQGECADLSIALSGAADQIERLTTLLSRFCGLASSALAPLQIMESEAGEILRALDQ